jgi:uncharacterized membrane protein
VALTDLQAGTLEKILRPTVFTAIGIGFVGAMIAWWLGAPLASYGIAFGVAAAILNVRILGKGVMNAQTDEPDGKQIKGLLRNSSAVRLVLITAIVIGLVLWLPPLGIGAMVGLVVFQIAFVVNAGRAVLSSRALLTDSGETSTSSQESGSEESL